MPQAHIPLAKVMTQAKDNDNLGDQVRRGPGHSATDLREPPGQAAAGRTDRARPGGARALGHAVRRLGHAGEARRDEPGRAGRARAGAATVDDTGHRRAGRMAARHAGSTCLRPAAGGPDRDPSGPGTGREGTPAPGRLAGHAAERADSAGAGDAARGRADSGEAQPVLTGPRSRLRTFRSLGTRNYRLFAVGQVVSNSGTWMQRVAQDWLVLQLTHGSGTALGIATGLQFLPMLASPWGGAVADRYPKRRILMVTQTAMGLLALILGVLALTGTVRIWQVYALAFGLGLATVVDNPTRQAFVTEMVGQADMPNAIALNSAIFNLARIAGPAAAGLVIGAVGTPAAFFLNAASYGAVLTSLKLMRPGELHPVKPVPRHRGQLREGFAYVRARPQLLMPMVLIFFVATFGMNFQVTNALMSRQVFHTGATAFGVASAVFAVGALAGALLAARRGRPGLRLLVTAAFAFGLLEVLTALMPSFWLFLAMLVPTGLILLTLSTAANSTVQLGSAPDMRGRVMGLYMLVFLGGAPLGSPMVGWVAEQFGPRMSLLAGGVISAAAAGVIGLLLARRRGIGARDYLRPGALARMV